MIVQSSLVPNAWANQASVKIISGPDCVFVPTWWACSLILSFKDIAVTLSYHDWFFFFYICPFISLYQCIMIFPLMHHMKTTINTDL